MTATDYVMSAEDLLDEVQAGLALERRGRIKANTALAELKKSYSYRELGAWLGLDHSTVQWRLCRKETEAR